MAIKPLEELNKELISEIFYSDAITPGSDAASSDSDASQPKKNGLLMKKGVHPNRQPGKKRSKAYTIISDIVFFLAVLVIFVSTVSHSNSGAQKKYFYYSFFTVLTSSMQDEIPKDSLILTRKTDPQNLQVGDNITFIRDRNVSVTHKIVDIYENYLDSNARGFQTKGVNNDAPDSEIVYEESIIGKVIFFIPAVGAAIYYLRTKVLTGLIIFGLFAALYIALRIFQRQKKANGLDSA
ncbi:MAG: signal peptidase I [Synergistaceae bacterium]|nr:signal peptidase I [Synergistaceae bacterium]